MKHGKTHQIRVHFKHIGHPLLGDFLYGRKSILIDRQALHSYKISFIHPVYREEKHFKADLPADMEKVFTNKFNYNI